MAASATKFLFCSDKYYATLVGMITATRIAVWAGSNQAQLELPRLIRRLVHATARATQIAIPAGDSVVLPGFDGELHSEDGSAWVPAGYSCWELSCRADVGAKATEDFEKRTLGTPAETRRDRTYVAVTARRWPGKARWQRDKADTNPWKDVRAYDADDLEQWLEQSPAVALAFAEELGITGPGVESLANYIAKWGGQSFPAITPEALLTGRHEQAGEFLKRVERVLNRTTRSPLAIKADSVQEAVAFAASTLVTDAGLAGTSIVVTDLDGWRFVERNRDIRIAIAATPAIAEAPTSRLGLAIIVPFASGDMARQFRGVAGQLNESELHLERAMHSEFEKALQLVGMDENDTRRLSILCGRSWSIFRRQHAANPAIRRPAWLDHAASSALATVCLVGTWSSERDADREVVSRIAGRSYAELEADLLALERLDDSPLLHIGAVWKAKSALELLAIFGEQIDPGALNRYFFEIETILATPDPQLELPDEKRYAAAVHGKTRPISSLLLDSLCDTLIKLSVRGSEVSSLALNDISLRIDRLVRAQLRGRDRVRWLSLSSQLPALAEAAPHEFLLAVEESIAEPDGGARAVFLETKGSGLSSRCWHAGMLWALETLAWNPNRLKRVSIILARLCDIHIEGNWGNNPMNSLLDLYRPWLPQTAATIGQRIDALNFLIERAPGTAYELLDRLTSSGMDSASHIARPKWRDDDAGAGYGATALERHQMEVAAIDRQIEISKGNAKKIARLIIKYATLDEPRQRRVLEIIADCRDSEDTEKEELRKALRHKLHWHHNHDATRKDTELRALLDPLDAAYVALEPKDLIIRHAWLFHSGWIELPIRSRDDEPATERHRALEAARTALREIFDVRGWEGVTTLVTDHGQAWIVGAHLSHIGLPRQELERWIVQGAGALEPTMPSTFLAGAILCGIAPEERTKALDAIFALAEDAGHGAAWLTRLLMLCPHDQGIWQRAETLGQADFFWSNCSPDLWLEDPEAMAFALRSLVSRQRPVAALNACHLKFSSSDPEIVAEMLEGILKGHEVSEGRLPRSYVFQHAIDYLEASACIDEMRLLRLEFALIRALGFEQEHHAKSLFHTLMSQPTVFVELLCLIYKPRHGEVREVDDATKSAAENAWSIIRACKRQPGTLKDNTIDDKAFAQFVCDARKLAEEQDRLDVCDSTLGQIMAHAPEGTDGIWPFDPARDALEQTGSEKMLNGFHIGCFNKRGVSSRGPYDGGDQERDLAVHYRKHALVLEQTHPRLSATLMDLARSYDRHGLLEDLDARLRQERH